MEDVGAAEPCRLLIGVAEGGEADGALLITTGNRSLNNAVPIHLLIRLNLATHAAPALLNLPEEGLHLGLHLLHPLDQRGGAHRQEILKQAARYCGIARGYAPPRLVHPSPGQEAPPRALYLRRAPRLVPPPRVVDPPALVMLRPAQRAAPLPGKPAIGKD